MDDKIFYAKIEAMLADHRERKPRLSKMDIAHALEVHMEQHDLTQDDMAKRLEVTRFQIIRWTKGTTMPNKSHIRRMKDLKII